MGNAYGAYVSAMTKNLKRSGLTGTALETALNAIRGVKKSGAPLKIPRKVIKNLSATLVNSGRAVVVFNAPNRFKVFSLDGHQKMTANMKKHKPWLKSRHVVAANAARAEAIAA